MTEHYGSHAFNLGELRGFRLQIYPTVAALTGDAGTAYARLAFVAENQQFYWGRSGSWIAVPVSGGAIPGNGTVIDTVTDPSELNFRRTPVTWTVLTSTPGASSITVNIHVPHDLDHLTSGDSLVITGSLDSGSNNWLDGTYTIDSVNTTTGEIVVVGGVPEIPVAPAITYGNYTATDLTYPTNGSVAVVNPDSAVGGPVLWVFDGLTSSWKRFDDADIRLVFRDGSRTFTVIPVLDPGLTDIPTLIEKLVSKAYLLGQILGYTTGPHYIDSINSAGANTVVHITTTDSAAMAAAVGKTLRTAGTGTALDGDHVILASSASTIEVANLGVTVSSPPGTTAVYDPGHEFATMNDVTAVGGDLAAHIAAPDPHPQYTTDAEVASAIGAHVALPDPHTQYTTDAEATSLANSAVSLHNGNVGAHPGHLADGAAHAATFANHNADAGANSAAFAAHNSNVGAHSGAIGAHNVSPSAHPDIREAINNVDGGGSSAILEDQWVDPTVKRGQPVYKDPVTDRFLLWDSNEIRPVGVAEGGSTETTLFEDLSARDGDADVEFSASGYVTINDIAVTSRLSGGDLIRFPGSVLNTGWKYVTAIDLVTNQIYLRGTVLTEAPVTTDLIRLERDAKVYITGELPLPRGVTKTPALSLVGADIDNAVLYIGDDIGVVKAGDRVTIAGSGSVPSGTYDIAAVNPLDRSVALSKINHTVVDDYEMMYDYLSPQLHVFLYNVATPGIEDVTPGMTLHAMNESDHKYAGRYTITSIIDPMNPMNPTGAWLVYVLERPLLVDTPLPPLSRWFYSNIIDTEYSPISAGSDRDRQHIIVAPDIASIDADIGNLIGSISFDYLGDLITDGVREGDLVTVSGALNPANNGTYVICQVFSAAVTVTVTLAADQGSPGGTGTITGERADGTATFKEADDSANFSFDSSITGAIGPVYYADPVASDRYSKDPGPWAIGILSTTRDLFVYIDETGQVAQSSASSTATLKQTPRQIAFVDGTTTFTLSLPAAPLKGDYVEVFETSKLDMVTISGNGKNIAGAATYELGWGEMVALCYDGTEWKVVGYLWPNYIQEITSSLTLKRRKRGTIYHTNGTGNDYTATLWTGREGDEITAACQGATNNIRLTPVGGATIDGAAYFDVGTGTCYRFQYYDADTNWVKIT